MEHDQIGRALGYGNLGLIATMHDVNGVALGLEVVAEQKRQGLFVLDHENFGLSGSWPKRSASSARRPQGDRR